MELTDYDRNVQYLRNAPPGFNIRMNGILFIKLYPREVGKPEDYYVSANTGRFYHADFLIDPEEPLLKGA